MARPLPVTFQTCRDPREMTPQVPLCPTPPPGPVPEQARIPLRHALLPRSKSRGGSRGKNRTEVAVTQERHTQTHLCAHARPECTKPDFSSPSPLLRGWHDPLATRSVMTRPMSAPRSDLQPPATSGPGQAFPRCCCLILLPGLWQHFSLIFLHPVLPLQSSIHPQARAFWTHLASPFWP